MFGFPKQLPGVAEIKMKEDQVQVTEKISKTFLRSMLDIWMNPVIVTTIFVEVFESITGAGTLAFGLKYLEQQFYLTPVQAGVFSGLAAVSAAIIGIIGNGAIIKIFNLNVKQCAFLYLVQTLIGVVVLIPLLFIPCSSRPMDGLIDENRQVIDPPKFVHDFNQNCECLEDVYSPYCVEHVTADGTLESKTTYFSPCYAGCTYSYYEVDENDKNLTIYGGCEGNPDITAKPGYCETECGSLIAGGVVIFLNFLVSYGATVVIPTIMVRIVDDDQKPLVLANRLLIGKLLDN
mgnify:CR=1 FL=1